MVEMEKHHIVQEIEETLTQHKQEVPTEKYLSLVKEYRDVCIKLNRLLAKEKDRNRKFISVKRKLVEEHITEIKGMQTQVNDYKRVIEKYKLGANNPKHLANKTNNVIKNVQSIHKDINSIINESFSGNNIQEILQNIIKHLTAPNSYFDFQKITLQTFDSHKIQVLQRAIYKVVTNIIETESTSVVSAITNTILRNKFQYIHTQFAKHILDASNISRGVFKFFGDICVEQTEGQRWHSFAITRFMKEYSEQQTFIKELKDEIIKLRNRLKKMQPVLEKLELEFSEEYYELAKKSKQLERLIHKQVVYLSEEKLKFADLKGKYDELLFAVTKTLLEKRRVIKVD